MRSHFCLQRLVRKSKADTSKCAEGREIRLRPNLPTSIDCVFALLALCLIAHDVLGIGIVSGQGNSEINRPYRIGLNFGANESKAALAPTDLAGVPPARQANWNNLRDRSGSLTGLIAETDGTSQITTATVQWNSNGTWGSTGRGEENNQFAVPDRLLMTGYIDTGDSTTTSVTVSNLPAQLTSRGYDVFVYALGGVGSGRGGGYRILDGSTGRTLNDYVLVEGTSNPSTYLLAVTNPGSGKRGVGNYIVFHGLTASSIIVEATTANSLGFGSPARAPINAIQFVSQGASEPPVPPASLDLQMFLGAQLVWSESPSANISGYRVYRSTDNGPWDAIVSLRSTRYVDKAVLKGPRYRYRVVAVNTAGVEGPPSAETTGATMTMQIREIEDYNYEGGKYPGFFRCPLGVEAPSSTALDSKYDYFYTFNDYWVPPNPYRPDSMVVADDDPDPAHARWVIGWTFAGDWWRYTFDVPADGWVRLTLRAATPGVANVNVFWDEERVSTITCHTGDWGLYDDFSANELFRTKAGRHTLRLSMADAAANLDLFGIEFSPAAPSRRILFQDSFEGYADAQAMRVHGGWGLINGSGQPDVAWTIQQARTEPRTGLFAGMNGGYVIADSGSNSRARVDEALISPMIDCRGCSRVQLAFADNAGFNTSDGTPQNCDVDLDVMDDATGLWSGSWTRVFHRERSSGDVANNEIIPIGTLADGRRIRLRWRFHDARWDLWWAVDNVQVTGEKPQPLVAPTVTSFSMNDGNATTASRETTLKSLVEGNPSFFLASERADFGDAQWMPYASAVRLTLSPVDGTKTVYFKIKNVAGESSPVLAKITLAPQGPSLTVSRSFNPSFVFPSETAEVAVEVASHGAEPVLSLDLQESLPIGWIFDSVVRGPTPTTVPRSGQTGSLVFGWDVAPTFPYLFVYRVRFAGEEYLEPVPKAEMPMKRPLFAGRWGIKAADFLPGRQNSCL